MAGRSSTLIGESAAAMIYENTSSSVQVCSINLCSSVATVNPSLTIKLHSANSVSLNKTVASSTPAANVTRFLDGGSYQSTWGAAASSFSFEEASTNGVRYVQGNGGTYGASSDNRNSLRYTCLDPWMFINPSDYFDGKVTTYPFWVARAGAYYWWLDGSSHWPYFNELWIEGYTATSTYGGAHPGDTAAAEQGSPSYFTNNYPMCHDWYTAASIGANSNGYLTGNYTYLSSGAYTSVSGNRTSNSSLYGALQGNNPLNYDNETPFCKMMQADRGVFAVTGGTYTSNLKCYINPVTNNSLAPSSMDGIVHFTEATNTSNQIDSLVGTGGYQITMSAAEDFQWIKYNKTAGKYYLCSKSEGIFSFTESDIWGVSFSNFDSFSAATFLTSVADYPFGTDNVQQPSKIGQNLWVTITDQSVLYYSTDLVTWQTATQYLESVLPALSSPSSYDTVAIDNTGSLPAYYFAGSSWSKFESGIDDVPNAGLLEKSEQAGTFERTGVILAPGDCIYVENGATNAKVGATVMYVEV